MSSSSSSSSSRKRIVVLGATGSIGVQALEVIEHSDELEAVALSAHAAWETLTEQAQAHGVTRIALSDAGAAERAAAAWPAGDVHAGAQGLVELIVDSGADLVLNAIVGSAGLGPTIVALGEGIDVALANKESLVVGGELVTALAEATGTQILPVDSEHAALHQLIAGERAAGPGTIERLTVTASGGPFRGFTREQLTGVTAAQALAHPTWSMGDKITIDSATLMNKGLEVIEAHHLFGLPYGRIDVLVHPQSIVHGLVSLCDGAVLAHLGCPDMRVPIAYALHHPERAELPVARLDLAAVGSLTFEAPDLEAFPALRLAREAALAGGTAPAVLNAANEIAVRAFLDGQIAFTRIAELIETALDELGAQPLAEFDVLFEADRRAREVALGALA
jgi:1-deoxy-D-xylulose-5-phosphate reductoisomerase